MVTGSSETARLPLVILKVGTRVLVDQQGNLKLDVIQSIARQIKALQDRYRFVLVTSGAIAMGKEIFRDLTDQYVGADETTVLMFEQMCAGAGMPDLVEEYRRAFSSKSGGEDGLRCVQLLLEHRHFEVEATREQIRSRVQFILRPEHRTVVIANENDVVAPAEIKEMRDQKDNDRIAANLAQIIGATHLIVVTSTNGVLADRRVPDSTIPEIKMEEYASLRCIESGTSEGGRGGMGQKIERTGEAAVQRHVEIVGHSGDYLDRILVKGERVGTRITNGNH